MASVRGAPLMTDDLTAFLVAAEARLGAADHDWDGYVPDLVALVGMMRAVLLRHHPETNALAGQPWCYECSTPARALLGKTDWSAMVRGDQDIPWPCPTVTALLSAIPPTPTAENISTILARESAEAERTWAAEERGEQEPPRLYRANPPTPTAEETR